MIILLGSTGYVGSEFARVCKQQNIPYQCVGHRDVDLYNVAALSELLRSSGASFLVNCAGFTGKPNVDACELQRGECLLANAVLPERLAAACEEVGIPWGHVSSGCIYTGTKADGSGFTELDPPNFSFRQDNCSFYSGTKALGEECLQGAKECYVWRLRIPFDHRDSPRNYLSKVMNYQRLLDATNSLSHLREFVESCLYCWQHSVPYGIYNVTNTGSVTTRDVVEMLRSSGLSNKQFDFFEDEEEFMRLAAKTPRSNTVLDNSKALAAGLPLSPVRDVIQLAIDNWQPAPQVGAAT